MEDTAATWPVIGNWPLQRGVAALQRCTMTCWCYISTIWGHAGRAIEMAATYVPNKANTYIQISGTHHRSLYMSIGARIAVLHMVVKAPRKSRGPDYIVADSRGFGCTHNTAFLHTFLCRFTLPCTTGVHHHPIPWDG